MKPSLIVKQLRQIATNIDNSQNPQKNLVISDLKRVAVILEEEESTMFLGAKHPATMTAEQAIEKAKEILSNAGYSPGKSEIVDIVDAENVVFYLEMDQNFVDYVEQHKYFTAEEDGVEVSAEWP